MKNEQRAKLDSYQRVQAFNTEYGADLATVGDYAGLQTSFDSIVQQIMRAAEEQQKQSGVTPELLEGLKQDMAETVIEFASRGVVKAQLTVNDVLANKLDEPVSYIFYADKNTAVERATDLRNTMNDNLAVLTNIRASNITAMDDAINAYINKMNEPVIHLEHKKSLGTDPLPGYFKSADKNLDNMFRLVKSYFFRTKPTMVSEMALAMQIINTGIRHTIVNITVTDGTNAPIEGATAIDNSNSKSYVSDFEGVVHIDQHKSGHDSFTISATGKQTVSVGMDIKRGTENAMTVKMVNA